MLTRGSRSTTSALKLPSPEADPVDDVASRDPKVTFGVMNSVVRGSKVVAVAVVRSGLVRKFTVGRVEAPPCGFVVAVARVLMSFDV